MKIGYARVSTDLQSTDLQIDALKMACCERIFTDTISGTKSVRVGLSELKSVLQKGDQLIVWRLDRLGRSLKDLIETMTFLESKGVALKSLQENIDTSTASGKLIFHVFGALAEFERNLIVERTNAGLAAAKLRGRKGGRKEKVFSAEEKASMKTLYTEGVKIENICVRFNCSKPTFYKAINSE